MRHDREVAFWAYFWGERKLLAGMVGGGMLCVCSGDAAAGKWMLRRRCRNGDAHVTGYDLRKVVVLRLWREWLLVGCEEEKEGGGFWRRCYRQDNYS